MNYIQRLKNRISEWECKKYKPNNYLEMGLKVDEEIYSMLDSLSLYKTPLGYFVVQKYINKKKHTIGLHRLLTNCPKEKQVDHINGNASDNRSSNLRIVSQHKNMQNTRKHREGHLQGTSYRKDSGKWKASIWDGNKVISLGSYLTQEEAHEVWKKARNEMYAKEVSK